MGLGLSAKDREGKSQDIVGIDCVMGFVDQEYNKIKHRVK